MAGLGLFSLGSGPYGLGTPTAASAPPDPADTQFSRYINPASGDYEVDPDTLHLKQMPPIRQRVILALKTTLGSATAYPSLGLRKPQAMGDDFEGVMTSNVRFALQQMTDVEGVLRIDGILVGRRPGGRATVTLAFTDLTKPGAASEVVTV